MSVQVVTVTSRIPDRQREPYYRYNLWHDSLTHLGCEPTVLGMGEHWGGLMTKPRRLRDWLRSGACTADTLIVTDSYDVVFTAPPEEVAAAWHAKHVDEYKRSSILFNAEKGIFPRGELAHRFEHESSYGQNGTPWFNEGGQSPWRYLNSGFYIGEPTRILQLLEAMWLDDIHDDYQRRDGGWTHPNDQGWYQTLFCAQPVPMTLDYRAEVVQCCSACTIEEFDLTGKRIKNVVTGTEPLVWHFNGGSKNSPEEGGILHQMLKKWGMEHYI
jgi:hypothetical protein